MSDKLFVEIINDNILHIYINKANICDLVEMNINSNKIILNKNININGYNIFIDDNFNIEIIKNNNIISKISFNNDNNKFNTIINIDKSSNVFGLGDKLGFLDKKGYEYSSWNTDDCRHQNESFKSLYKSVNYLLINSNNNYYGIYFPSTYRYDYDVCKHSLDKIIISNEHVNQDFYLFLNDDVKKITSMYSNLVGHPYFIRFKMLGYNQSRWSYKSEDEIIELVDEFEKYDLPLDYVHLDIDYMDGYRDFTFNKDTFKNPKALTDYLKSKGVEVIAINDAAIKQDDDYYIYKYLKENNLFAKLNNDLYINAVWPGDSAFPNYFNPLCIQYLNKVAEEFIVNNGISGIWNDMNEPASFKGELPLDVDFSFNDRKLLHEECHNVYGEAMCRSLVGIYEKYNIRPYIFTRAAFATTAKYSFVWNGDNASLWQHLKYSIPQILNSGLSNFMINGVDIGGFMLDCNNELLIRFIQALVFTPFMRNHSCNGTRYQEPYKYDELTLDIYRKYVNIRYKFAPYLYTLVYEMNKYGRLVNAPLFYYYQNDKIALNVNDEYMVGPNILVAPILDKDSYIRLVYLPAGNWKNIINNKIYEGNKHHIIEMDLSECGIFVKLDTIIAEINKTNHLDKEKIDTLILHIYGNSGECMIYDDDGISLDYQKDIYNIYNAKYYNGLLSFECSHNKYNTNYKFIKIIKDDFEKTIPFNFNFEMKI